MVRIAPRQRNERRKGERTVPFERVSKIDGHEESSSLVYSITVYTSRYGWSTYNSRLHDIARDSI